MDEAPQNEIKKIIDKVEKKITYIIVSLIGNTENDVER